MVNNRSRDGSTKAIMLARLRELGGEPISGEQLASKAGVSRVAVWKAAEALRSVGYAIVSDEKGYRLDPASRDDFLYPWEFPDDDWKFRHWEETESTMDRVRELADRGAPTGTVAVAERQRAGRGRAGKSWSSEEGGLFFTVLFGGGEAITRYARTAIAVQIAVAKAIRASVGAEATLRWPNDVYIRGRKVAGILTELRGEADRIRWISVGVGLNVNNPVSAPLATSCSEHARHILSRRTLLRAVLDQLGDPDKIAAIQGDLEGEWNALAELRGRRVAIMEAGGGKPLGGYPAAGRFLGINAYGKAVLETERGTIEMDAGTASLRPTER